MSGGFSIKVKKDTLTPAAQKALKGAKNKQPILRAAGTQILSIAKRSFREPGQRQSPWRPKRDGKPSNLILHGVLSKSIRIVSLTASAVEVGSDRKYAAIHQLGGVIRPDAKKALRFFSGGKWWTVKKVVMPARPFLPFDKDGKLVAFAAVKVSATIERAAAQQIGAK